MSHNSKWKDLGFASRAEYVGWLWFNGLTNDIKMYDDVYYDEYTGKIINKTKNIEYQAQPFPEFLQKMIQANGLVNYVNEKKKG